MRSKKKVKKPAPRRRSSVKTQAAPAAAPFAVVRAETSRLASLGEAFGRAGWSPASEALREIRAVPTIFPWVDWALRVGGWPTDRFGLVHGPSNEGKTTFIIGLLLSFLVRDHAAAFIDAERSTPLKYVRQLMGAYVDHVGFRVRYPGTYEETVDDVRSWAETIGEAREKGRIDKETTGIIVLDSIRKLVPKRLLDKLLKDGAAVDEQEKDARGQPKKAGGVDGMRGMAARYKAMLNAAWMDELTVLLAQTGTCMVAIGREYENDDANVFADDFKLGGGQALFFESSVVARVGLDKSITDDAKQLLGERHFVQIRKTKIAGKLRKYPIAYFHTSSGLVLPAGFDRGRDLIGIGKDAGVVDVSGSWLAFDGKKLGQGELAAALALAKDRGLMEALEAAVRASFPLDVAPEPVAQQAAPQQAAAC